jgi:hypothetical protein
VSSFRVLRVAFRGAFSFLKVAIAYKFKFYSSIKTVKPIFVTLHLPWGFLLEPTTMHATAGCWGTLIMEAGELLIYLKETSQHFLNKQSTS